MYKDVMEKPEEGQLCLCKCPHWCPSGFQVATFENGVFGYDDQPNDLFHDEVIGWIALDRDGVPIL